MRGIVFKSLKITGKVLYVLLYVTMAAVAFLVELFTPNKAEQELIDNFREINTYGLTDILPSKGDASRWQ